MTGGGRFDFDDGGTYCGGWEDGKAHGHGVCTGPKGQGEYSGAWQVGFEISGVYAWPSGNNFMGQWTQGKRHGLGVETKGRWVYRGEWTQGFKGRYGVRQSTTSGARYEGTWTTGLQDGYGLETYADGGTYAGQWLRGMRHGYGVRQSVPYGVASHYRSKALRASLTSLRSEQEEEHVVKDRDRKVDEGRGGFVLTARSDDTPRKAKKRSGGLLKGLRLRKQKSTGDIQESPRRGTGSVRSTISNISHVSDHSSQSGMTSLSVHTDGSTLSFYSQDDITDNNVTESYLGEWKNDKRSGFGVSKRSDGLCYEGEWFNNKKFGYGVTTFKDGAKEEGKYKNNILISSGKKNKLFLMRTSKLRERIDNAVVAAQRASQIAAQKADIALSRCTNARAKAEQADAAAARARADSELARVKAKEYAPEFHQPGRRYAALAHARAHAHCRPTYSYIHTICTDILKNQLSTNARPTEVTPLKAMGNHTGPPGRRSPSASRSHVTTLVAAVRDRARTPVPEEDQLDDHVMGANGYEDSGYQDRYHADESTYRDNGYAGPDRGYPPLDRENPDADQAYSSGNWDRSGGAGAGGGGYPDDRYQRDRGYPDRDRGYPDRERGYSDRDMGYSDRDRRYAADPGRGYGDREPGYHDDQDYAAARPYAAEPYRHERFSNLLNSQVVHDHFNQYRKKPPEVGETPPSTNFRLDSRHHHQPPPQRHLPERAHNPAPPRPDTDTRAQTTSKERPLPRRRTLPSIVQDGATAGNPDGGAAAAAHAPGETTHSQENLAKQESDTFIIENGIRKRVKAEQLTVSKVSVDTDKVPRALPSRYKMERTRGLAAARGSLPDVKAAVGHAQAEKKLMPRAEAHRLGERRREELRREREEEERRKQQEIVLRLADVRDWCQQRQVLMLVIAVNVSLATMFFNMLTQ